MKQKQLENILHCIWSTDCILVFSAVLFLLYQSTQFLLFRLGGIFLMLLSFINLLLLFFAWEPSKPIEPLTIEDKEKADTEGAEPEKKRRSKFSFARTTVKKRAGTAQKKHYRRFTKLYRPLQALVLTAVFAVMSVWFFYTIVTNETGATLDYWHLAVVIGMFAVAVVLDMICKHIKPEDEFSSALLRNVRIFFTISKILFIIFGTVIALRVLLIGDIQKYAVYVVAALFCYVTAMILFSLAARFIRKEMATSPSIVIFVPFVHSDKQDISILTFLEENTGITLRSLWSIRYIKSILPYSVLTVALLFWLSTGIVNVNSNSEGIVYRFGKLQDEVLEPGLHYTLPYPFAKSEIYDTETLKKITVGYNSVENQDNVWTEAHGDSEYKLLLGSGNELVSVNIRIEYKIDDLEQYVRASCTPEKVMEAKAYELILARTINTDLDNILSVNRETFANSFREQLVNDLNDTDVGLEVVNIVMESIHPPVEVAQVYQDFIGAEIDAETLILDAQAEAAVRIAESEFSAREFINLANIDRYNKLADAHTEIAQFMAAVEASNTYPEEYSYYKYLEAICNAYRKARLVILGDGVDGGRLYIGDLCTE